MIITGGLPLITNAPFVRELADEELQSAPPSPISDSPPLDRQITVLEAAPINDLKKGIQAFVKRSSELALFETIISIFEITIEQTDAIQGYGDLIKNNKKFHDEFKTFLRGKTSIIKFTLIQLILPTLKFIFDFIIGRSFDRIHDFLRNEIHEIVTSSEKRTLLLGIISLKVDKLIEIQQIFNRNPPDEAGISTTDEAIDSLIRLNAGMVLKDSQNLTIDELFDIYLEKLTFSLMEAFCLDFDLNIHTQMKQLVNRLESKKTQLENDSSIYSKLIQTLLNIGIGILKWLMKYITKPLGTLKNEMIRKFAHYFDGILKTIIGGALEGLFSLIQNEKGFDALLQSEINDALTLYLNRQKPDSDTSSHTITISDDENALLIEIHHKVMDFFNQIQIPKAGLVIDQCINVFKNTIFEIVQDEYKIKLQEDIFISLLVKALDGCKEAVEEIGLSGVEEVDLAANQALIAQKTGEFRSLLLRLLQNVGDDVLGYTEDVVPIPQAAPSSFWSTLQYVYNTPKGQILEELKVNAENKLIHLATSSIQTLGAGIRGGYNRVSKKVGRASIEEQITDGYALPKLMELKKTFLDDNRMIALVKSLIPELSNYILNKAALKKLKFSQESSI